MKIFIKNTLFGTALLLCSVSSTWALDQQAFIAALQNYTKANSFPALKQEKTDIDGNNVILRNVKSPDLGNVSFGDIVFNNVQEGKDGSYTIDKVQINKIEDGKGFTLEGLTLENARLGSANVPANYSEYPPYTQTTINNIKVAEKGIMTLIMKNIVAAYPDYKPNQPIKSETKVGSFELDFSDMPAAKRQGIEKLGYLKVRGQASVTGTWNPQNGDMDLSDFTISAQDVGTLRLSVQMKGLTQQFMDKLDGINPDTVSHDKAMELFGLVEVQSIKLRYDDDSFFNRVFDYTSKEKGVSRSELASTIKQPLAAVVKQKFGKSKFGEKLISQVGAFLDDPKSMEVSFNLPQAMPFVMFGLSIAMAPGEFLDQINADITANK